MLGRLTEGRIVVSAIFSSCRGAVSIESRRIREPVVEEAVGVDSFLHGSEFCTPKNVLETVLGVQRFCRQLVKPDIPFHNKAALSGESGPEPLGFYHAPFLVSDWRRLDGIARCVLGAVTLDLSTQELIYDGLLGRLSIHQFVCNLPRLPLDSLLLFGFELLAKSVNLVFHLGVAAPLRKEVHQWELHELVLVPALNLREQGFANEQVLHPDGFFRCKPRCAVVFFGDVAPVIRTCFLFRDVRRSNSRVGGRCWAWFVACPTVWVIWVALDHLRCG